MSLEPQRDVEAVPLSMLRRYLRANRWRLLAPPANLPVAPRVLLVGRAGGRRTFEVYVLSDPGEEDVELVIPADRSGSDFLRRMEGAIKTLAEVEGRSPEEVITSIRSIGFDVVRSRIPDDLVLDDSIHLAIAANYIDGFKRLLSSTATTELLPSPYFLRVRPAASDYADSCRFGHTFRGSFGFTIESPLIPNTEPTLPGVEPIAPFERRVIQRLASGIGALCRAVEKDDPDPLLAGVGSGLNANSYEQLADLVDNTAQNGLAFAFSFSPEWAAPAEIPATAEFRVGPRHVELSKSVAKTLRSRAEPRDERVVGRIMRLQSQVDPSDLLDVTGEREVVILWSTSDMGDVRVRVRLSAADYLKAIEAHRAGRIISVKGTLEQRRQPWVLTNPTDFQ